MTDARQLEVPELTARVGQELGVSPWHEITQPKIDGFAEITEDWQFIHTDRTRAAAETTFGGTIAHGFLSLSLLSAMAEEVVPRIKGTVMALNYGFDRVRFLSPVLAGAYVRGRFVLQGVSWRTSLSVMTRYDVTVEIRDSQKPALFASWLTLAQMR